MLPQIMCPVMGLGVSEEGILFLISTKVPFELVVALALVILTPRGIAGRQKSG